MEHIATRTSHSFLYRTQLARRVMNERHRLRFPSSFSRDLFLFVYGAPAAYGVMRMLHLIIGGQARTTSGGTLQFRSFVSRQCQRHAAQRTSAELLRTGH